jgi:exopolysaccharide biosynthesis protein
MNTKILGVVIGVLILLLGIGGFFYLNSSSNKQTVKQTSVSKPATQNQQASTSLTQASIKSLLASKTPQECSFSDNTGTSNFTGTIFVANGKASGEFNVQGPSGPIVSHMVSDGTNAYIWTSLSKQGFKMALAEASSAAANAKNSGSPDVNKTLDFKCKAWSVDNSKFTLPTDITFTTFNMPNVSPATGGPATGSSVACSACNSVPQGAQRTACLQALHCQ